MFTKSATIVALGIFLATSTYVAAAAPSQSACDPPKSLQHEIERKFPNSRIVNLSDLTRDDRGFFQHDHGNVCPGLVKVDFYGDGKPTVALVLITKKNGTEQTALFVAHQIGSNWKIAQLETGGPVGPVLWTQPPGNYTDVYGEKSIRAVRPVIVFCKYESWAILYAWTGKSVKKIWIMD
jgi:hypothetical protein